MKTLIIKRIDDLEEAKNAWNKLSPDKTISDNWDYRYCFYKYFNYPLFFYAGYDGEIMVGLLPLQFNEKEKRLQFFGSDLKDNRVFIKPGYEECIPQFYKTISGPVKLLNITGGDPFTSKLDIYRYKYIGDLSNVKNADDYLDKNFKSKSRYKLRKKIRSIQSRNPNLTENDFDDIDLMMELNKKNFGEKSLFNLPHKTEIYHDLLKLSLDFHVLSFAIDGKKEAASFALKYKETYVYINTGTNKKDIPDLGTYNTYINLENAIKLGAKSFDAGLNDLGWKEIWHLEKIPQRYFMVE